GKAGREPDPVERALDAWQALDAGAVLGQHGPPKADHRAVEAPARPGLQIQVDRRARWNMPELGLAEVGDDVPGARIHEREHFHPGPGEGAVRNVQVDDLAGERRVDPTVA